MDLQCVSHLRHLMSRKDLKKTLKLAKQSLKPVLEDFDTIAVRGVSGLLSGPILALALNKDLIVVRKEEEPRHSTSNVEGNYGARRYVIVDDFIDTGATAIDIVEKIYRWNRAECIGVLETYNLFTAPDTIFSPPDDGKILQLVTCKSCFDLPELMKKLKYGNESTT